MASAGMGWSGPTGSGIAVRGCLEGWRGRRGLAATVRSRECPNVAPNVISSARIGVVEPVGTLTGDGAVKADEAVAQPRSAPAHSARPTSPGDGVCASRETAPAIGAPAMTIATVSGIALGLPPRESRCAMRISIIPRLVQNADTEMYRVERGSLV